MKFTSPLFHIPSAVFCASLFFSCSTPDLDLPLSPEEKFAKSSSSATRNYSISSSSNTFNDKRDNKTYELVQIYPNTWMAKNLNYDTETDGSKCYNDSLANCDKYGRLYNWATAKKACPTGWHLPTKDEWGTIINSPTAGNDLKSAEWDGIDVYRFAALPGGYGDSDGYFALAGKIGIWWTATENSANYAYNLYIFDDEESVELQYDYKSDFYSVRCVQD
jgi:uncharacterized protein (TIGR02145 family)